MGKPRERRIAEYIGEIRLAPPSGRMFCTRNPTLTKGTRFS